MGKTRVVVQVVMVLLDDPTAGKPIMRRRITHYPPGVQRLRRLPGIGTISLIHVLAEVGCFLGRFDSAERAAAGYQRSTTLSVPPISVCR
jgi:hypothetical protein